MKSIKFITLMKGGEPRTEKTTGEVLNTVSLIKLLFDNCTFKNRADQRIADKVYGKLQNRPEPEPEDATPSVELEDAEFDIVFKYAQTFPPFLIGRSFEPFFKELEKVENP